MKIKLLVVGKTKDSSLIQLTEDYVKRLSHYTNFEFQIIPDLKKVKNLSKPEIKEKEGTIILNQLENSDWVVVLDEKGKEYTSMQFSSFLQKKMNAGHKQLIFIIGGPYGFSDAMYKRANEKLSFSKMTFSHQMIRLFAVEQIYRGFTILKNEPYHHE
jgi:23S rRNA (pseudouridine1915-N3)-methyltransferase